MFHPVFASSPQGAITDSKSKEDMSRDNRVGRDVEALASGKFSVTTKDSLPRQALSDARLSKPRELMETMPQSTGMDIDACFAIIIGQVASLAARNMASNYDLGAAVNETTPLQSARSNHPFDWPARRKWIYTFLAGLTMFNASFASTAVNGAGTRIVKQYGLSQEEMVFITGSFIGGCVAGPIVWAPLSEMYGRRPVGLTSMLLYSITNIGCALAPSKFVLFSSRFLAGACASSAFSNAAAVITDLFAPPLRSRPMIVASLAPLLGPCFGPLFGALVSTDLRWPFVFWVLGAIGLVLEVVLFCVPETYQPVIEARTNTKNRARSSATWRQRFRVFVLINLGRPINMMCREPIVVCATFYLSLFFSLMYLFFVSWPLIFGPPGIYRLDTIHTGITFLPMAVGGIMAAVLLPCCDRYYRKRDKAAGSLVPEARLLPTFFVAPLVAAGLL